ncbi:MAG TPA: protein kinase [Ktedonobacteraceae bacterium]|nr:protein kinase [Ktedonobacteraceae bacterium]
MAIEELQGGRYRYLRLLGSGGMGEVYLMEDTRVSRQVAIKVVRAEGMASPDGGAMTDSARLFQREAKAIAALEHPNILPLYDFGEEAREDMAVTYMVMPYCADGSLEGWLRQRAGQPLEPQKVAYLVEQAAEALQYAHDHDVIHLDVKPSNFLLRANRKDPDRPILLLADFGIARNFTTVASSSHTIRGTPTSMAPEQWSGNPVFASDQYALAVMAYEMLVGRPPFRGSMEQLMYHHFTAPPPAPGRFNPRLPAALDAVLLRALSKKPEERFPSIADFASAFVEAASQSAPEQADAEGAENYATLTISQSEADAGLSRLLTLASGEEVTVTVPAGARDGQIIRVQRPHESSEQAGPVLVNILVKQPATPLPAQEARPAEQAPDTPPLRLQPVGLVSEHDLPTIASSEPEIQIPEAPRPASPRASRRRTGIFVLIPALLILLVLAGSVYLYASHQSAKATPQVTPTQITQVTPTPSPTPQPGLYIAGTYNGSMTNQNTYQTNHISVYITQTRGQGILKGSVTFNSSQVYQLSGRVDLNGNFGFTVQQAAGQTPLYFYGAVQQGVYLHGNYCSSSTASCSANTGYFTVGPRF